MPRKTLIPQYNGDDCVATPLPLADAILAHFPITGRVLDPCRGGGAFWRDGWDWCEIKEGRDFLTQDFGDQRFDWCVGNPPWSQYMPFLEKAMTIADNVVYLYTVNGVWMKARIRQMRAAGFGIREIGLVATPPKPWPQAGFQIGVTHFQRGWVGDIKLSDIKYTIPPKENSQ